MDITQLIFDLDGTLVDSFPGIAFSAEAALAQVLPGRAAPDFRPFIGPPIREIFRRALPENDPAIIERLEQSFRSSYNSEGWRKTRTYPGVEKVLAQACQSGRVCRVLTNKPKLPTHAILQHLGLDRFVAEVITPDGRLPAYASKIEAALDAKHRHGLAEEATLLVGDSEDDRAAAAACDFQFAAVTFGYGRAFENDEHPVHFRLECFEDLSDILHL
jgi:phosphoglycolate phosphatase